MRGKNEMSQIKNMIKTEVKDELFKEYGINDEIDTSILEISIEKATSKYWDPNFEREMKPKYHSGKSGMALVEMSTGKSCMFANIRQAKMLMGYIQWKYKMKLDFVITEL